MKDEFYKKTKKAIDVLTDGMNKLVQSTHITKSNTIGNISSSGNITSISTNGKSRVEINGDVYSGNSVIIKGNKVIIDGVTQEAELTGPEVIVNVQGDAGDISTENGTI
ncbi:MAG: hypothetical protein U9N34_04010, partial [Candidatus Cloacimonadota bacterium]|nr:hypothetical protein [Candidatus Cloacimonadota bacterium]